MTKQFQEMTIVEKLGAIAKVEGLPAEMVQFLNERAEKQAKANAKPRKASETSSKLQIVILELLSDGTRVMADDVFAQLVGIGYTDEHKTGLTIARVRSALSALAKEELIQKFDADRKKDAKFPKVSYMANVEETEEEGE